MTHAEAKHQFTELMTTARRRKLTHAELKKLSAARQHLRRAKRPAMNKAKTRRASAKKNPARVRMGRLVELRYDRDHGSKPGLYYHRFKSRPVVYYYPDSDRIVIEGRR